MTHWKLLFHKLFELIGTFFGVQITAQLLYYININELQQ
jgi:hypothetical protein